MKVLGWHYVGAVRQSHIIINVNLRISRGPLELEIPPIVIPLLASHWR